jgi:hypothetical protein
MPVGSTVGHGVGFPVGVSTSLTTRAIELVDEKVTSLASYLVTKIDGEAPARHAGRHALPDKNDLPAITGGTQEGMLP